LRINVSEEYILDLSMLLVCLSVAPVSGLFNNDIGYHCCPWC